MVIYEPGVTWVVKHQYQNLVMEFDVTCQNVASNDNLRN